MKYRYHCWNPHCPVYCGLGYMVKVRSPVKDLSCPHCGHHLEDCTGEPAVWLYALAVAIGGWLMGLAVADWEGSVAGLAIGIVVGLLICGVFGKKKYSKDKKENS